MQKGLKLATVQVTPDPLFRIIVQRPFLAAFRTRPFVPPGMFNPKINPLGGNVKFHPKQTTGPPGPTSAAKDRYRAWFTSWYFGGEYSMKTDSDKIGKGCYAMRYLRSLRFATRLYSDGAIPAGVDGGYPLTSRKHQYLTVAVYIPRSASRKKSNPILSCSRRTRSPQWFWRN